MLVVQEPAGAMLLVRQPDHAATCAQLAEAWQRPSSLDPQIWASFVEAAGRHDDGWMEAEKLPVLGEDGTPLDFKTIPTRLHVDIWRRSVELARPHEPFAALMIALHARTLYTQTGQIYYEDQRLAQELVNDLTGLIDHSIGRLSVGTDAQRGAVEPRNLETARRLLSFFDGLSLALVGGISWFDGTEPLVFGDQESTLGLSRRDSIIYVDPWPFTGNQVTLTTIGFHLRTRRYRSAGHLAVDLARAKPVDLNWRLQASPTP